MKKKNSLSCQLVSAVKSLCFGSLVNINPSASFLLVNCLFPRGVVEKKRQMNERKKEKGKEVDINDPLGQYHSHSNSGHY